MKLLVFALMGITLVNLNSTAHAGDDHTMISACKAECPDAKTEHDAHKCMKVVVKKKKGDKGFKKSECFHAFEEHEKSEKESGHKH